MAARNLTGSAWIRAAGNRSGTQKNSPESETWMGTIRAGIDSSIESMPECSVSVDADAAAVVHRRVNHSLTAFIEHSGKLVAYDVHGEAP